MGAWGALPATNNAVESLNGQLRHLLREHRGLSLERRVKAICWWCYMHTECPLPAAEILKVMPTDKSIAEEMGKLSYEDRARIGARQWGMALSGRSFIAQPRGAGIGTDEDTHFVL